MSEALWIITKCNWCRAFCFGFQKQCPCNFPKGQRRASIKHGKMKCSVHTVGSFFLFISFSTVSGYLTVYCLHFVISTFSALLEENEIFWSKYIEGKLIYFTNACLLKIIKNKCIKFPKSGNQNCFNIISTFLNKL